MANLRDAATGNVVREATEAEEEASDRAAAHANCEGHADRRGVFEAEDGCRYYVPIERSAIVDEPIGGPGGD